MEQLINMFPQIHPNIIQDILAAHNNNLDDSVSHLLEISDPTYIPPNQHPDISADEQLATQLSHQPDTTYQFQNLPYKPRVKRTHYPNTQKQPIISQQEHTDHQGKDEIQKITEEITKLAETGKKTMSEWFNKAIAKMQELQNPLNDHSETHQSASENPRDEHDHINTPHSSFTSYNSSNSKTLTTNNNDKKDNNNRITPSLPYGSRYQNTTPQNDHKPSTSNLIPSDSTSHANLANPSASTSRAHLSSSGYQVDQVDSNEQDSKELDEKQILKEQSKHTDSSALEKNNVNNNQNQLTGKLNVKDDDEESLEYTRNPFEDDD